MNDCVFCQIVTDNDPHIITNQDEMSIVISPLNPVTPGHLLVIPKRHVQDAGQDAAVTAAVFATAGAEAARLHDSYNLITSTGSPATQTITHLHVHIVPRLPGDGLQLPWTKDSTDD